MLSRAAERVDAPAQQAAKPETASGPTSWKDERIPLLGALPQMIPGTHPVEDEDDIVAIVEIAMDENVRTPEELQEWLNNQQLQMMRSGIMGRGGISPSMAERTVRTLAKYLAVRASIHAQMLSKSVQ